VAALEHRWGEGLAAVERPPHVDRVHAVQFGRIRPAQVSHVADPGVVDLAVERRQPGGEREDGHRITLVGLREFRLPARGLDRSDGGGPAFLVAVDGPQGGARRREAAGDRLAYAGSGPGTKAVLPSSLNMVARGPWGQGSPGGRLGPELCSGFGAGRGRRNSSVFGALERFEAA